jgi:hypothetical protein
MPQAVSAGLRVANPSRWNCSKGSCSKGVAPPSHAMMPCMDPCAPAPLRRRHALRLAPTHSDQPGHAQGSQAHPRAAGCYSAGTEELPLRSGSPQSCRRSFLLVGKRSRFVWVRPLVSPTCTAAGFYCRAPLLNCGAPCCQHWPWPMRIHRLQPGCPSQPCPSDNPRTCGPSNSK